MRRLPFVAIAFLAGCSEPAPPAASAPAPAPAAGLQLAFPLACTIGLSCEVQHYVDDDPGPAARDYRGGRRTYDGHNGTDIRIPDMAAERAGVAVLAAAPGRVARLRDGVPDASIRAAGAPDVEGRECGNGVVIDHGQGWETQYCHLAQGSLRVKVGDTVAAGQPIADVGLSGNTEFAHLHMSVRRQGVIVDPFAPGSGAAPLWNTEALKVMAYKAGAALNVGFAPGPVTMEAIEAGTVPIPAADAPALVVYGRAIGLEGGDEVELALMAPDGAVLVQNRAAPLDRDKAQSLFFIGRKRPPAGWPSGTYRARYQVHRAGRAVVTRDFAMTL